MNTPYENLASAIVVQAANDYRKARRDLNENPGYGPALLDKSDVEQFFRSDWYKMLTNVDGERLLSMLQREAA